jgi:two-component system phosphate regulon sensor histidine kinase PhoR
MKHYKFRWQVQYFLLILLVINAIALKLTLENKFSEFSSDLIENQLISEIYVFKNSILNQLGNSTSTDDLDSLAQQLTTNSSTKLFILDPSGNVLGTSGDSHVGNFQITDSEFQEAINLGIGISIEKDDQNGVHYFSVVTPVETNNIGFIYLTTQTDRLYTTEKIIKNSILVNFILLSLFILIPQTLYTSAINKRLENLTNIIRNITQNFNIQLPPPPKDNLEKATDVLNHLAVELESKFKNLEQDQARIDAVLSYMNDGVMILDQFGYVVFTNLAFQKIFNVEGDQTIGHKINRVIPYYQIIDLWEEFESTGLYQGSLIELSEFGKLIQVNIFPFETNTTKQSILIFQDLTKLRQLETVRRDFISNISHELRTPLASLKAIAETLQISALDDPTAARKFLEKMDTEIDSLTLLVNELLELSRIESGQVPLEMVPTSAWEILSNAFERMKILAEKEKIDLTAKKQEGQYSILADPPRLTQVLVNIIHNAIKFSSKGGKIRCSLHYQEGKAIFRIRDNGIGIPREDLPRIFERFYKSRRVKKGAGTGLGLSIAKHLVEAHGGEIWVESQLGEGSTFYISLPIFSQNS